MATVWILERSSANDRNVRENVFAEAADVLDAPSGWLDTVRQWVDSAGGLRYGVDNDTATIWFEEGTYSNDRIELSPAVIHGTEPDLVTSNRLHEARHVLFLLVVKLNTESDSLAFPEEVMERQQISGQWRMVREDNDSSTN